MVDGGVCLGFLVTELISFLLLFSLFRLLFGIMSPRELFPRASEIPDSQERERMSDFVICKYY